jgi:hypothetical protein
MTHYRLYCIDGAGRFFRFEDIEAPHDAEATRLSLALRGSHAAELWTGARHVATFDVPAADGEAGAPAMAAAPGAAATG